MSLHYFGSKAWFKEHLKALVPPGAVVVSPFFGSGQAELHIADQCAVAASDSFAHLVNFHNRVNDESIFDPLGAFVGLNIDRAQYQCLIEQQDGSPEAAAAFYVVMRYSYSGKFGCFVKNRPLTKRCVELLRRRPRAEVTLRDAFEAIEAAPDGSVIYVDPPYVLKYAGRYYAKQTMGDLAFQQKLARALKTRGLPFILHASDASEVLKQYDDCIKQVIVRETKAGNRKRTYNEVLIVSPKIEEG